MLTWHPSAVEAQYSQDKLQQKLDKVLARLAISSPVSEAWCGLTGVGHPYVFSAAYLAENFTPASPSEWVAQKIWSDINRSRRRAYYSKCRHAHAIDITFADLSIPAHRNSLERANDMLREIGQAADCRPPSVKQFRNFLTLTRESLGIIQLLWPQMYEEMVQTVYQIVAFSATSAIGFADVQSQGIIFLREGKCCNALELAEDILHESSHIYLNLYLANIRTYHNDELEIFSTPFRRDLRPMFGLVHQLFVLRRLACFYTKLLQCKQYEFGEVVRNRLFKINLALDAAMLTVRKHALLTDSGKRLIDSIEFVDE